VALKIDFSYAQSSDLKTLEIYDTTGIYNSTTNVGGWGTPNPQLGSATSDKISIQKSDGSAAYEFEMFSTLPNVAVLPNIVNQPFIITNVMLGLSALEQIVDGQYQLVRTTIADGVTYRRTRRVFLIGQLQCCADQMLDGQAPGCSCESGRLTNASIIQYTIFTLRKAFLSQKFERANQIFVYAQSLCDQKTCKTC
jgi:hypothetical protein